MRFWNAVGRGTTLIVAGVVLFVGGVAALMSPQPRVAAEVGSVLVPAGIRMHGAPRSAAEHAVVEAATPPIPMTSPSPSEPARVAAAAGFVPQRLTIDVLDLDAPLVPTVVDAHAALRPPADPAELGWWRGVRPGQGEGSVVVAGHVDSRRYGQGPLAAIVRLQPGDQAVLTATDGTSARYIVRGVETFPKAALPAGDLFGTGGPERLVLVTCGGTFDRARGGWDSNVVALLDPAPAA